MTFQEKLFQLRKEKGLSQEALAERMGVSRQAVSKWESGLSNPDINNLVLLSDVFGVSLDELIKGEEPGMSETKETIETVVTPHSRHYEYRSQRQIGGLPLLHVNFGRSRGHFRAKGIIAIGNIATGLISIGLISAGLFSVGALSFGLLALGGLALGVLLACGGVAAGGIAIGGIAFGIFAVGGLAVGMFATGGCAVASHIAVGGYARGHIASGDIASGVRIIEQHLSSSSRVMDRAMMAQAIDQEFPEMWSSFRALLIMLYGG
ncbi:helix-turn-helix transcriptional regulator [Eubacterium sp. 1001713B170207_170306_E7]|uniref:helix-turn-helix domain-containing protein n=1 Tax=Eubacterium sp. 1001713B170207_170306_E7 TaxID=2787097 RepID=UPI00189BC9D7|nr:helix-turn-helix transcriptional regulator [Eubacterium sp. 1001713B170207_170306_E7]